MSFFVSNATAGVILIPVGRLLFRVKLTPIIVIGMIVASAGLVMMNRK